MREYAEANIALSSVSVIDLTFRFEWRLFKANEKESPKDDFLQKTLTAGDIVTFLCDVTPQITAQRYIQNPKRPRIPN